MENACHVTLPVAFRNRHYVCSFVFIFSTRANTKESEREKKRKTHINSLTSQCKTWTKDKELWNGKRTAKDDFWMSRDKHDNAIPFRGLCRANECRKFPFRCEKISSGKIHLDFGGCIWTSRKCKCITEHFSEWWWWQIMCTYYIMHICIYILSRTKCKHKKPHHWNIPLRHL